MNMYSLFDRRRPPGATGAPQPQRHWWLALASLLVLGVVGLLAPARAALAQVQPPPIVITKHVNSPVAVEDATVVFTITVEHTGEATTPPLFVAVEDLLPGEDLAYLPDSFATDQGQGGYDPERSAVFWNGGLQPGARATLSFGAKVLPLPQRTACGPIINVATGIVFGPNEQQMPLPPSRVALVRACDLGDAPDSTNHTPAAAMTAYAGPVMAKYPTVYDPATGAPPGPLHRAPRSDAWLGARVSGERDADLLPDQDLVTNLHPAADIADRDNYDDGILRMPAVAHCVPTDMQVAVTVVGVAMPRYINAWIDWDRDGDWDDTYTLCPGQLAGDWVVRDFVTNLGPGVHAVTLPIFLPVAPGGLQTQPYWLRVTLAEQPAPQDGSLAPPRGDGRGPLGGYKFGETEDYRAFFAPPAAPQLAMVKQANVTNVNPGGFIEWTITLFNSGNAPANNVVVYDPIPAGTSYVAGSVTSTLPTASYNAGQNRVEWLGNIPAGGSVTIKFQVQVSPQIDCGAVITNRAEIVDPATGQTFMSATATVKVNCEGEPLLDLRKTADVTSTAPGGQIEYTIVILNSGTGPATAVVMHDLIPAGTTFVVGSETATAPTVVYNAGMNRIEWTGNIPAGGSVTIKFKVQVADAPCGSIIENRAGLLAATGQYGPVAGAAVPVICPEPRIEILKRADVATVLPGGQIAFVIKVVNSGSGPANGVLVQDPIPAGTTYVAGTLAATAPTPDDSNPSVMQWTGNIPAGGNVIITFKVQVAADFKCPDAIRNRALLEGPGAVNRATEAVVEVGCPDQPILQIAKQANPQSVPPGGAIAYTIVISNAGSAPAVGVMMVDPIPAGTTYVPGTLAASAPTPDDSNPAQMQWSGNIPAGGSVTLTFSVQVAADALCDAVIHNRAGIMPKDPILPPLIAAADAAVFCGEPKLSIEKRVDVTQTVAGGQIEYTLVIANGGAGPATGVTLLDAIPTGTTYVTGSATATAPTVAYNPVGNQIQWNGNIPAGGSITITFKVTVNLAAPCQEQVHNRAVAFGAGLQVSSNHVATLITCGQTEVFPDFGDAPDGEANHHGLPNTAYPVGPVPGRFPSVWDNTPVAQPSGPRHHRANQYWLGDGVTPERDADLLPDADGTTNILNAGAADTANNDKADDGWLNPAAPMPNCRETVLKVRVARALIPPPVSRLYLNVWFDGNRDGDWNDMGACPDLQARSFEWIVQNWWIDPTTIAAGGFVDIAVPTVLVHNLQPNAAAWLRFTLSEQRAAPAPGPALPDGRGPAFPTFFALGETEDYLRPGEQAGQPGQIVITKTVSPGGGVNIGDVLTYTIGVRHMGGAAAATTSMTDVLPAGLILVGPPVVTELTPSAAPLIASFNPGGGPSGAVFWQGILTPDAAVQIQVRVRVRECVTPLVNRAVALNTDGKPVAAETVTTVNCQPGTAPIVLTKSVFTPGATEAVTNAVILPGEGAVYKLILSTGDGLASSVQVSDSLPAGLVATGVNTTDGTAVIINGGQTVVIGGIVGLGDGPVTVRIAVKATPTVACGQRLVNVATWTTAGGATGRSNEAVLTVACRDLGDAPDSTNNAGAAMTAYPAVPANYPTVFTVAAPNRGPRHEQPRPFHLGRGVTGEAEADSGPDMDGVNNIRPAANDPDRDEADDGLVRSAVGFQHCQPATMKVEVAIAPGAAALLPNGIGYLNIWLDSDRNGDWAGVFQCPSATGAVSTALEHIVIDLPVNAGALGPGLHSITVPTNGPVFWRSEIAQRPAWLRLTLSDRPANKPLTSGGVPYGDGRGYDDPFRLGETEDLLLRLEGAGGEGDADPGVTKHGEIWPDFDPATNQRRWVIGWVANYQNPGPATANNVHVVDTLAAPQTQLAEHSIPLVAHTGNGPTLDYNVGSLPAGGAGMVIVRSSMPFSTAPGTVITNTVVVQSSNDGSTVNNTAVATVTVPLLPPLLAAPLAGTTCTTTVTIAGWVQPGAVVDLYVDGVPVATNISSATHGNGQGDWTHVVNLPAGSHTIHAVARAGSMTSAPSPSVMIIVDPALFWDPLSLRFTADDGHVIVPAGRLDPGGWSVFLRPGHTYTATLRICCEDPNAQVTMEIGSILVTLTDADGDRTFTGVFTVPLEGRFTGTVRICVTCRLIRVCSDGEVTIDPEGTVYDLFTVQPVDAATVACMQSSAETAGGQGSFSLWQPSANSGQVNPQVVGSDGYFSFFTPAGTFRLEVAKPGYQPYTSHDITVVDAPVHYDVPLTPLIGDAAGQQIAMTDGGFEPSVVTIAPGTTVEWLNAGATVHASTSITPAVSYPGARMTAAPLAAGGWDSGLLEPGESYKLRFAAAGVYTYRDEANPTAEATIIVAAPVVTTSKLYLPVVNK